jgi:hypothetical protein
LWQRLYDLRIDPHLAFWLIVAVASTGYVMGGG